MISGAHCLARTEQGDLGCCLAAAGVSFGDVVKLTFFVLHATDLLAACDAVIDADRPPASTAVQVATLFAPATC
jgi:hypothetical protein